MTGCFIFTHMKDDIKVKDEHGRTLKAGGVVVRKQGNATHVLLVFRPKHSDWQFPKGHVAEGETLDAAALREVEEETGLAATIVLPLPSLSYETRRTAEPVTCHMFLMTAKGDSALSKHADEQPEWVPVDDVAHRLTKENLKAYFASIEPQVLAA